MTRFPASPPGNFKDSVKIKRVYGDSSSAWSLVRMVPLSSGITSPTFAASRAKGRSCGVCLDGGPRPDVILRDTTGDGYFDTVEHLPRRSALEDGTPKLPNLALDFDGDGTADTMVLDTDGDGSYDQVLSTANAPLSFLAALASDGSPSSASRSNPQYAQRRPNTSQALVGEDSPNSRSVAGGRLRSAAGAPETRDSWPLAPGWERVWSRSQSAYYYCHRSTRRVTWDRAEAAAASPPDSDEGSDVDSRALSPGWEMKKSKSTSEVYYHHLDSGRTTWNASEARIGYPLYWRHAACTGGFLDLVHGGPAFRQIQMLLTSTFMYIRTRDRKTRMPVALEAVKIWRIENSSIWRDYATQRAKLLEASRQACQALPGCEPPAKTQELLPQDVRKTMYPQVNEVYLFHGTSAKGAAAIARQGFDIRRAAGTACYGQGIYFSECSSKSDEYSPPEEDGIHKGHCAMLLCRVALGSMLTWPHAEFSEELKCSWASGAYHSILGDRQQLRGTYREFVLPRESCVGAYPEYLVIYRRCFDDDGDSG